MNAEAKFSIVEYSDELAGAFRDINAQWIQAMYRMEDVDRDVLDHPKERILDTGGTILFVKAEGLGIVGTCALRKTGPGEYELTKMGVLESARGLKAGEYLLAAVLERSESIGAKLVYLLSNHRSEAAIHLYEKLGFVHDADIMREHGAHYERCDIAMRYVPRTEIDNDKDREETGDGSLVTVARSLEPLQIEILRARLQAEGIPAFSADAGINQTNALYSIALGGVRLMVPRESAQDAQDIIALVNSGQLAARDDEEPD
jgi:ribosomal protein S18 acetylase RimI-like enzyme